MHEDHENCVRLKPWTRRRWILTEDEFKHLNDVAGCKTQEAFQRTIDQHDEWRMANPGGIEPCWECRFIAVKLNMKAKGVLI